MGAPTPWNKLLSSVKSVENIAKVRWRINQSVDNWICVFTMKSINPSVLMRL